MSNERASIGGALDLLRGAVSGATGDLRAEAVGLAYGVGAKVEAQLLGETVPGIIPIPPILTSPVQKAVEKMFGNGQAQELPLKTIVLLDDGGRPAYTVGGAADEFWKADAHFEKFAYGTKVISEPKSPKEIVDKLIEQAERDGQPLGDIEINGHGSPGCFGIGDKKFNVDDPEVIAEFSRLKAHMAPGAKIVFGGCQIGSGDEAAQRLQRLADATGTPVVAYKWYQVAGTGGVGPRVEFSPKG